MHYVLYVVCFIIFSNTSIKKSFSIVKYKYYYTYKYIHSIHIHIYINIYDIFFLLSLHTFQMYYLLLKHVFIFHNDMQKKKRKKLKKATTE